MTHTCVLIGYSSLKDVPILSIFPALVQQENTQLVKSKWPDIGLVLSCVFIELFFVSIRERGNKNLIIILQLS